ncbi:hypothetical protein PNA2_0085 [Pyrococcus sp. NA2]|uniref:DUF6849 domain-containing protein n=1 Tax=Pyrococcus sp. (strain NA2) TaxID=342949 RepID=UPI000209ADBE|nr:ATPase [Pyrococcus sp. NA2]AEC51003.1 hypothetical protein PNA2_0085 [Pyrococcus sp. NA2]
MALLKLKPLIGEDLPSDFVEVIRSKLRGRVVRTGETVGITILGKVIEFKVVQADPSPLRVDDRTRIEFSKFSVDILERKFDGEIRDVIVSSNLIVVIVENEVIILNQNLEEIYRGKFEKLKNVVIGKDFVVIADGNKLKLIRT